MKADKDQTFKTRRQCYENEIEWRAKEDGMEYKEAEIKYFR